MKRVLLVIICLVFAGCVGLTGSKSADVEKRVRTLGVLPVLVDAETIDYSNRDGLVALLEEASRDADDWLVERLRAKGDYFDVRLVDVPTAGLLEKIVSTRTVVGEGAATHHTYTFDPAGIAEIIDAHLVDGLLVVVFNGVKRHEKRWSEYGSSLDYLETEYSSLLYSAAVVAAPAEQLWRREAVSGDFFLRLDYPDLMEAHWNLSDEVYVKEITLPGLQRRLAEQETGLFVKTTVPEKYNQMIRELVDKLKYSM